MSTGENPSTEKESGNPRRWRRRRASVAGSSETTTDGSLCFSDSDSDSDNEQPRHSPLVSTAGGSFDECRFSEIEGVLDPPRRHGESSASDCLSEDIDLESGDLELKVHSAKEQRDCRICHLSLVGCSGDQESGVAIELGCYCKGDLAAAHKQCSETWFRIRGNTTCEICGATALNVVGEQTNEGNGAAASTDVAPAGPVILVETRSFWHGHRIMNILLACMVFAFVISWLFHFNVIS